MPKYIGTAVRTQAVKFAEPVLIESVEGDFTVEGVIVTNGTPSANNHAVTKGYVDDKVSNLIDSSPETLDTLNELAASLADDANFAATMTNALALKASIDNPNFTGTVSGVTKDHVGLGNVDNTADQDKPISSATQTALDAKAPTDSPTFTGTVSGVTKADVGLGSVDNTSDADKPVSSATQSALDQKAPIDSPNFTGTVTGISAESVGLENVTNESKATMFTNPVFTGSVSGVQSSHISDLNTAINTEIQANSTFSVAVQSFTYRFDGNGTDPAVSQPNLHLYRGFKYYFNVNATGHPFWINTQNTTGKDSAYSGVSNNGIESGVITFEVPMDAPNTLYYNCEYHASMNGEIYIVEPSNAGSSGLSYTDTNVDSHLNTGTASGGQVLSWNGADYQWVNDQTGVGGTNYTDTDAVNAVQGVSLNMGSNNITTSGKVYFANVFPTEADLPSASTYHGMFAHVHGTGAAYFAHAGAWIRLANQSEIGTGGGGTSTTMHSFSANAGDTVFTVPHDSGNIDVWLNGVYMINQVTSSDDSSGANNLSSGYDFRSLDSSDQPATGSGQVMAKISFSQSLVGGDYVSIRTFS